MKFTEIQKGKLPVSLSLAKQHLRVGDSTHDDELIESKVEMAVSIAEDMTGRLIRERGISFNVLFKGSASLIYLPVHTARISEVSYLGNKLLKEDYTISLSDFEQTLKIVKSLPNTNVSIKATVGYTDKSIPPAIKAAILFILGTLYDNESDTVIGRITSELPLTAERLLSSWRISPYGDV